MSFLDIDYEMIAIGDYSKPDSRFFPRLNPKTGYQKSKAMKDLLQQTPASSLNHFEIHGDTLHLFHTTNRKNETEIKENKIRILIPLQQIRLLEKRKTYTRFIFKNGKTVVTSIPFHSLEQLLMLRGFNRVRKNTLKPKQ